MAKKKKDKQKEKEQEVDVEETTVVEETTEVSEAAIEKFKEELAEAMAKADENLDGWQRAQADLANYRKRVERERETMKDTIRTGVIKRYLDVSDDLVLALKNKPQEGEGAEWAEGIALISRKLETLLEGEGLTMIEADGQQFDPRYHEAVSQEDSEDHESGQIIDVLKPGYMLGEKVLRAALVRVAV